jgi:hypothetical protein
MLVYTRRTEHAITTAFIWSWRYHCDRAAALTITATINGVRIGGISALLSANQCEQVADCLGCATVAHELLVKETPYTQIEQTLTQMEEFSRATATKNV